MFLAIPNAGLKGSTLQGLPIDSKAKHYLPNTIILAWTSNLYQHLVK